MILPLPSELIADTNNLLRSLELHPQDHEKLSELVLGWSALQSGVFDGCSMIEYENDEQREWVEAFLNNSKGTAECQLSEAAKREQRQSELLHNEQGRATIILMKKQMRVLCERWSEAHNR